MSGLRLEDSDVATPFNGTFFDVDVIIWVFSKWVLSSRTTVKGLFNFLNNWLRYSSFFRTKRFAASTLFWCCIFKLAFSAYACTNEKTSEISCSISGNWLCICSIKIPEWDELWIGFRFCCVVPFDFYVVPGVFNSEQCWV